MFDMAYPMQRKYFQHLRIRMNDIAVFHQKHDTNVGAFHDKLKILFIFTHEKLLLVHHRFYLVERIIDESILRIIRIFSEAKRIIVVSHSSDDEIESADNAFININKS